MPAAFVAAGTPVAAASGNITTPLPDGTQPGHLLAAAITTHDTIPITLPDGWTSIIAEQSGTLTAACRQTFAWHRHTAGETAPTFQHPNGDAIIGALVATSGILVDGDPIDSQATAINAAAFNMFAPASPTVTTTGCLLLAIGSRASSWPSINTMAGTTPGPEWTEATDASTDLGATAALAIDHSVWPNSGTWSQEDFLPNGGDSATNIVSFIALLPQPAAALTTANARALVPARFARRRR